MIAAMLMLMWSAMHELGAPSAIVDSLRQVEPGFMHWFPDASWLGALLFVAGWVFAGFGVAG